MLRFVGVRVDREEEERKGRELYLLVSVEWPAMFALFDRLYSAT